MPSPDETGTLDSAALREAFLLEGLFAAGELRMALTDLDRLVAGAAMPLDSPLALPSPGEFGTAYFTERREIGVINIGGDGHLKVGGVTYSLGPMDFLYIGAGQPEVSFERCGDAKPSFYFLSCPAHRRLPVVRVGRGEAQSEVIGQAETASRRRLHRYLHPGGVESCQLVMGMTELESGSVWNTMPSHLHSRRSEIYLYAGLGDGVVVHLLGEPERSRHLIVRDREAVLSPSWSLHCGAGTQPYSFVWGMAGENQSFSDIDPVEMNQLR